MNKKESPFQMKGKGATVGAVICVAAVIAIMGVYTFKNYQKNLEEQLAKSEEMERALNEESEQANTEDIVLPEIEKEEPEPEVEEEDSADDTSTPAETTNENVSTSGNSASSAAFTEDSHLDWPASCTILINYSMDQTTYFTTLDQYRYNPALIISGEEAEPIYAAAAGTVKSIDQLAQTGITVTLDMGNGYEATYGQLQELPISEGQYLAKGDLIGYLSQPTKYYSLEGTNLYFEVRKDGESVNPMDYME